MAKTHFEKLGVQKLYATSDGQFFLLENRALLHANGKNVYSLLSDEAEALENVKEPISMDVIQQQIAEAKDVATLQQLMMTLIGAANLSEVVTAIDLKIRELINDPKDPEFRGEAVPEGENNNANPEGTEGKNAPEEKNNGQEGAEIPAPNDQPTKETKVSVKKTAIDKKAAAAKKTATKK